MSHTEASSELVACCLTSRVGAAVSMIGVSGSQAEYVVGKFFRTVKRHLQQHSTNLKSPAEWRVGQARFGHWELGNGLNEEVVACKVGEGSFEIQCHGGIVVDKVLSGLEHSGCRVVDSQQWLEFNAMPWLERQMHLQLQRAPTRRVAAILLRHLQGGLRNWLELIADRIENGELLEASRLLNKIKLFQNLACHLIEPWQVALAGPPNVGKSSLLNRILGFDRAIVHDEPGTTRDRVSGETAISGWPVRFTDTAGLRKTESRIESQGIALATELLESADLVLIVVDPNVGWTEIHSQIAAKVAGRGLVLANKSDLGMPESTARFCHQHTALPISAVTGIGLPELLAAIEMRLVPRSPQAEDVLPIIAELRDLLNHREMDESGRAMDLAVAIRELLTR